MSTPTATTSPGAPPALEVWIRSPLRRMLLVALGVVVLASASTLLWADAVSGAEEGYSAWPIFHHRLIAWGLWGLAFEPVLFLAGRLGGWLRPLALFLLVQTALSVGAAVSLNEAEFYVARDVFRLEPPSRFQRGEGINRQPTRGRPTPAWGPEDELRSRREEPRERAFDPGTQRRDERESEARLQQPENVGAAAPQELVPDGEGRPDDRGRRDGRRGDRDASRGSWYDRMQRWEEARERLGRNRRIGVGIAIYWLILAVGLAGRNFLQHQGQARLSAELALKASRLQAELSGARLSQLEAQLQPHFLFNSLHSVGGLVREGNREVALSTLAALGDLLRASLQHGSKAEVPLGEELDLVETYLDVERIRLGDRLDLSLESEPGTASLPVPTLLLLPLVENSIKYAIAPNPDGGRVAVASRLEGNHVVITVEDSGPGFPVEVLDGGVNPSRPDGIGLANTRGRMEALYGPEAMLLENLPTGGARITLRIPRPPASDSHA